MIYFIIISLSRCITVLLECLWFPTWRSGPSWGVVRKICWVASWLGGLECRKSFLSQPLNKSNLWKRVASRHYFVLRGHKPNRFETTFKMKNQEDSCVHQLSSYSVGGKNLTAWASRQHALWHQVTQESMGQINNATQLTPLITPCEVGLYPSIHAEGRHQVSALHSFFIPCYPPNYIYIENAVGREKATNWSTLHLHHKRRCVKYVFSLSSTSLSATHGLSSCVKSSVVLALKKEEETVICVLLIIVQIRGCPVITHVCNYRIFVL